MTSLRLVLLTVVTAACVHVDERIHIADKCAIIQAKIGQTCVPTVCADRDTSCPLIPDVLCASDECGCHVAFFSVVNQSGRDARVDVTDLCKSAAEIREASDIMERVLAGEAESRDLVASDPGILIRVFRGLNKLSIDKLKITISSLESALPRDRTPAMEKRRQYLRSELAALEERVRRRGFDAVHMVATHVGNVSAASSWEAQKELSRRKDVIHQWTAKQQRVQILDESVSMSKLIASARMASRKYAVDNQGSIIGSQLPIYGNILNSFAVVGVGISHDEKMWINDSGNGCKIMELYNQLMHIVLDEIIARRVLTRKNYHFAMPPVSAVGTRVRFNFRSFAPLMHKAGAAGDASLRLMSLASQTAALEMDLYSKIVGESPTALAGFALDWNIADDLTEFLF